MSMRVCIVRPIKPNEKLINIRTIEFEDISNVHPKFREYTYSDFVDDLDIDGILNDMNISRDEFVHSYYDTEGLVIQLRNGESVIVPTSKVQDYIHPIKRYFIRVKEVDCIFYYYGDSFVIDEEGNIIYKDTSDFRQGMVPYYESTQKLIKYFYWEPDEMNITKEIFTSKGLEKWEKIQKEFEQLYHNGEPVFVVCEYSTF